MLPRQKEMLGFLGKKEMATTLKNNLVLLVNLLQELKMTFIISLCLSLFFKREKTIGKNLTHFINVPIWVIFPCQFSILSNVDSNIKFSYIYSCIKGKACKSLKHFPF